MKSLLLDLLCVPSEDRRIILYCAGNYGQHFCRIMKICGITVDCFVDNNPEKWNVSLTDGVLCLKPSDVIDKESCIVFICIAHKYYSSVYDKAIDDGFTKIFFWGDILDDIIENHRDLFWDIMRFHANAKELVPFYSISSMNSNMETAKSRRNSDRMAVYTSIFGEYDEIHEPQYCADGIDYYYLSDNPIEDASIFQWIDATAFLPAGIDSHVKKNRFIKMHPHLIFPDYRYSMYVDGNIEILGDVSSLMPDVASGIGAFKHPERDCIYYEGLTVANHKRVPMDEVMVHLERYLDEGFPLHFGMPEMPVILREHNHPVCKKIMELWWNEFSHGVQRDQLSFMYSVWKNGMGISDISSLGDDVRNCTYLRVHAHKK